MTRLKAILLARCVIAVVSIRLVVAGGTIKLQIYKRFPAFPEIANQGRCSSRNEGDSLLTAISDG